LLFAMALPYRVNTDEAVEIVLQSGTLR
jgi:hypothetical protein